MSDSTACINARISLEEIRTLKKEFDVAYNLAITSSKQEDIEKARNLKHKLEAKMKVLQETLAIVETEHLFDLKHQYESQITLLKKTGLLETRTETNDSGETHEVFFMTGIDGREYSLPSYETIVSRMIERKELLETKADQKFTKLLLVPFGMSLQAMIHKFRQYLRDYKKEHPTFARHDPAIENNSDKPEWDPVYAWDGYATAEANNTLVYDPIVFDPEHHQGKNKAQILTEQEAAGDTASGWRILLLQAGENNLGFKAIPREGCSITEGTKIPRQDIEAGKSPSEYLANQQAISEDPNSPYHGESGMSPEEWIIAFIVHLEETGIPMDDINNNTDSMAGMTGTYFTTACSVPTMYWVRSEQMVKLQLHSCKSKFENKIIGIRSVVRT